MQAQERACVRAYLPLPTAYRLPTPTYPAKQKGQGVSPTPRLLTLPRNSRNKSEDGNGN